MGLSIRFRRRNFVKNEKQRKLWDLGWEKLDNTISHLDVFYFMDKIKLEYLLTSLQFVPRNAKTIEVGSGSARLSCFLSSKYQTTCLDYSRSALEVAKNNYRLTNNEGNFILGDAEALPLKDDSFDVVLSTGLLEHFPSPDTVVNEMVRILKPGGLFYADIVPKKFSLLRSLDFLKKITFQILRRQKESPYEKKLSKRDIILILRQAGLQEIDVFAAGVFLPIPRSLPPPIMRILPEKALLKLFKRLDKSVIAECLGFYYFTTAKKPRNKTHALAD